MNPCRRDHGIPATNLMQLHQQWIIVFIWMRHLIEALRTLFSRVSSEVGVRFRNVNRTCCRSSCDVLISGHDIVFDRHATETKIHYWPIQTIGTMRLKGRRSPRVSCYCISYIILATGTRCLLHRLIAEDLVQ